MVSLVVNHQPENLRRWVEKILDDTSTKSGFEVLRRLKLIPPIGASQEGLDEEQWLRKKTKEVPHYDAYLLAGDTSYWQKWIESQKPEA
jgi:hypothetical protein